MNRMDQPEGGIAERIARAALRHQQQQTGHAPQSATAVLNGNTLVIALHGVLPPAEQALARHPEGAAQLQELYRSLFASTADPLREDIRRITGVPVMDAASEIAPESAAIVPVFAGGTVVQVFLLAGNVATDVWTGTTA